MGRCALSTSLAAARRAVCDTLSACAVDIDSVGTAMVSARVRKSVLFSYFPHNLALSIVFTARSALSASTLLIALLP